MTPHELLQRAHDAGITVDLDGESLYLRAPKPPPADLLEDLRAYKPSLVAALRAEKAREEAVDAAWDRVTYVYERYGRPRDWVTDRVRDAEARVEELWLRAREDPQYDRRFHEALETWVILAQSYIATAGDRPEDVSPGPQAKGYANGR